MNDATNPAAPPTEAELVEWEAENRRILLRHFDPSPSIKECHCPPCRDARRFLRCISALRQERSEAARKLDEAMEWNFREVAKVARLRHELAEARKLNESLAAELKAKGGDVE